MSIMNKYSNVIAQIEKHRSDSAIDERLTALDNSIIELISKGNPTIDLVAQRMIVHPAKLRRMIKSHTGLTATDYINAIRMRKALKMLDEYPRYSITQVALQCGFADNSHFTHAFVRWFDETPSWYARFHTKEI